MLLLLNMSDFGVNPKQIYWELSPVLFYWAYSQELLFKSQPLLQNAAVSGKRDRRHGTAISALTREK